MTQTRRKLLENFDDEVREKLKVRDEASKAYLNRYERLLMQLTRHELNGHAEFLDDSSFRSERMLPVSRRYPPWPLRTAAPFRRSASLPPQPSTRRSPRGPSKGASCRPPRFLSTTGSTTAK